MSTDWDLVSQEEIFEEAKDITPKIGDEMKIIADNLIEKGKEEGREEGLMSAVIKMLEKSFNDELSNSLNRRLKKS